MITADQIFAHTIGDYVIQSDWMANEKTKQSLAAGCHALSYAIPFLWLRPSVAAMVVIVGTHFVIDRWRLARFVVYAKNLVAPKAYRFKWLDCAGTGYHKDRPAWLAVWLLIIADNVMHVGINALALKYL